MTQFPLQISLPQKKDLPLILVPDSTYRLRGLVAWLAAVLSADACRIHLPEQTHRAWPLKKERAQTVSYVLLKRKPHDDRMKG
jgi:hypothetical protein